MSFSMQEITLSEALSDAAILSGGHGNSPNGPAPLSPSNVPPSQIRASQPAYDPELQLALTLSRQQVY